MPGFAILRQRFGVVKDIFFLIITWLIIRVITIASNQYTIMAKKLRGNTVVGYSDAY